MKLKVTMKNPDLAYQIERACQERVANMDLPEPQQTDLLDSMMEEVEAKMKTWVKYGEYIAVEFDLEMMTVKVLTQ